MAALHALGIADLLGLYRRREASPVEVAEAVLDHAAQWEPHLHALYDLQPERVLAQARASEARWREGTGLGLPIAKALVDLHGGKLSIASAKDQGTTVTVILPSRHAVAATSAYKEAAEGAAFAVR